MLKARPPMDLSTLRKVISIRPASLAIDELIKVIPHVPGPDNRYNTLQRDLNLIHAITASISERQGLALIIDHGTGQDYHIIIEILDYYGARTTADYLREGMLACGGKIPMDELKRAKLALKYEAALDRIDRTYKYIPMEEAVECFVCWMQNNEEAVLE